VSTLAPDTAGAVNGGTVLSEVTTPIGSRWKFLRLAGGGYAYELTDEGSRIELRYLRRERGQLIAEVDVLCPFAARRRPNNTIVCGDLILSSLSHRRSWAKHCADRAETEDSMDWQDAIDGACIETIKAERYGADPIVLDDAEELVDRDVCVEGITIPADAASMLVAHGGTYKSLLLLYVLGSLALDGRKVLYLDFEWNAARHRGRKRKMFGTDRIDGLFYLRCQSPLTVEIDRIRRFADKHEITFFGVDSVGLAADGKLADDDTAIRFHRALGSLPGGKLCLAHVPKTALTPDVASRPDSTVTPFGSVFFVNLCRMAWAVRKETDHASNDAPTTIGLFPTKQNDGARVQPVGLSFQFDADRIRVERADLTAVEGLAERMPIRSRIEAALRAAGPMTTHAIADELGAKVDSIKKAVHRDPRTFAVQGGFSDGVQRIALKEELVG